MLLLSQSQITQLRDAAILAGLARLEARRTLLSRIDRFLVAAFPGPNVGQGRPLDRLEADLKALNSVGRFDDGTVPLATWLENGASISGLPAHDALYHLTLEACRSAASRVSPAPSRLSWGILPSPVVECLHDGANGGLWETTELVSILDAATKCGLVGHREQVALLSGVHPSVIADVPQGDTFVQQVALDIGTLNARKFGGGPLLRWLTNAGVMCEDSLGERAFSQLASRFEERLDQAAVPTAPPLATTVTSILRLAGEHYEGGRRAKLLEHVPQEFSVLWPHYCLGIAQALSDFYALFSAPQLDQKGVWLLRWVERVLNGAAGPRKDAAIGEFELLREYLQSGGNR